ncbi:MAG TPA: hypothetical protein VNT33_08955, partial [Telluria sp.]|nr:hypothetical protein [Telluria sp.]
MPAKTITALLHRKTLLAAAAVALLASGCAQLPATAPVATVQQTELDTARFPEIDSAIGAAIAERKLPGAVFRLERNGVNYEKAYGKLSYEPDA